MCLNKVTTTYAKPLDLIVDGWKEFRGPSTAPCFMNFGGCVQLDTWLSASAIEPPKDIRAMSGEKYRAGFHIYADERDLPKPLSGLRRVFVRKITYAGLQDGHACVIAQEMYVPSSPDDWPPRGRPAPTRRKKLMDRIKGVQ